MPYRLRNGIENKSDRSDAYRPGCDPTARGGRGGRGPHAALPSYPPSYCGPNADHFTAPARRRARTRARLLTRALTHRRRQPAPRRRRIYRTCFAQCRGPCKSRLVCDLTWPRCGSRRSYRRTRSGDRPSGRARVPLPGRLECARRSGAAQIARSRRISAPPAGAAPPAYL